MTQTALPSHEPPLEPPLDTPPHDPTTALAFETRKVSKNFGNVHAVVELSMSVRRGEVVALLGPNGAGKTTLIDMLLGFTTPTSGSVSVLGTTPQQAVSSGRVGAVLQTGALLPDLRVKETIQMMSACHHSPISTQAAMERAGITSLANRKVGKCSGGEQQRLRFALAMLTEPELLFLDEPTAGMDVRARQDFWTAIHEEAERGRSIVFATHYLQEATDFADRIIVLRKGRLEREGTVEELTATRDRTLRCTWHSESDPAEFARAHEATLTTREGSSVEFSATDTDALARAILTRNMGHTLSIHAATLDSVFMDLTEGNDPK